VKIGNAAGAKRSNTMPYQNLINEFVNITKEIIGSHLTGIYLHGSLAMGCFHPKKSDIDFIVVIEDNISDEQKMRFMEHVVRLNYQAPPKGLEVSIVKREYCNPFVYPTPYELHFSPAHLQLFRNNPQDYIANMKGVDIDLAAHFSIINHYGIVLCGEETDTVFADVPAQDYIDSICADIENAEEDIIRQPIYDSQSVQGVGISKRRAVPLESGGWEMGDRKAGFRRFLSYFRCLAVL